MVNVTFYYRSGCWLCDKAEEMLNGLQKQYDLSVRKVVIDSDPEVYELYRYDIPVLEFEDESALHGVIRKKDILAKVEEFSD